MAELSARDMKRARNDVGEEAGAYGAVAHAGIDAVMRKGMVDLRGIFFTDWGSADEKPGFF